MPPPTINPAVMLEIDLWLKQAARHRAAGELSQAVSLYQRILARAPGHPDALREMGIAALETGALDVAEGFLEQAAKAAPKSAPTLVARARAALAADRPAKAVAALQKARRIDPRDAEIALLLGDAHLDAGDVAAARRSFLDALRLSPRHPRAAHMAAALENAADAGPRNAYAAALFDQYAENFDSHLVAALRYDAPAELRALVDATAPDRRFETVLDLGCGTGLVAQAFAGRAGVFHGIDLSAKMVEMARAKGLYERLEVADLEAFLARPESAGAFDLIVAADVFIYVGALEASFAGTVAALRPGGLFAFSVEHADGRDVEVRSSGRFAHSEAYVERLAAVHGLTGMGRRETVLRTENGRPLAGRLFVFGRP